MKSTGVIRQLDSLGRLVIPKELRNSLGWVDNQDRIEIFVDGEYVILRKFELGCYKCEESNNLTNVMGRYLCPKCLNELKRTLLKMDIKL